MRPQTLIVLVVVAGSGILAFALSYSYLGSGKPSGKPVLVAKTTIVRSTPITPDMVEVKNVPDEAIPDGALTNVQDVVNRTAKFEIGSREIITNAKVTEPGKGGVESMLKERERAISVRMSTDRGVAGFIRPGSFVDVVHFTRYVDAAHRGRQMYKVKTLLQRVEILAVNQEMQTEPAANKGKTIQYVTFRVTAEQAKKLELAQRTGEISISMRGAKDEVLDDSADATPANLYGQSQRHAGLPMDEEDVPTAILPEFDEDLVGKSLAEIIREIEEQPTPEAPSSASAKPENVAVPIVNDGTSDYRYLIYRDSETGEILFAIPVKVESDLAKHIDDILVDQKVVDEKLRKDEGKWPVMRPVSP